MKINVERITKKDNDMKFPKLYAQFGYYPTTHPGTMPLIGSMYHAMTPSDKSDARKEHEYYQQNLRYPDQTKKLGDPSGINFLKFDEAKRLGQQVDDEMSIRDYQKSLAHAKRELPIEFTPAQSTPFGDPQAKQFVDHPVQDPDFYRKSSQPEPWYMSDDPNLLEVDPSYIDESKFTLAADPTTTVSPTGDTMYTKPKVPGESTSVDDKNASTYFGLLKGMDIAALIKNSMQPPPPTIQDPITNLSRVDLDTAHLENQKAMIKEGMNKSFRLLREGTGQVSDLMRGVGAVQVAEQEGLRQVGGAERELRNQEILINTDIANKEQMMIDQQNKEEARTNYQLQAEGQRVKDQMITQNLSEIKKDFMYETQYWEQKKAIKRQEEYDKDFINRQENLQLLHLAHEQTKEFKNSAEYKTGLAEAKLNYKTDIEEQMRGGGYGEPFDFTTISEDKEEYNKAKKTNDDEAERIKVKPTPDPNRDDEYNAEQERKWNTSKEALKEARELNAKKALEIQRKSRYYIEYNRLVKGSGVEKKWDNEYYKRTGMMSPEQINKSIAEIMNRNKTN
jgi:hypothetical protein